MSKVDCKGLTSDDCEMQMMRTAIDHADGKKGILKQELLEIAKKDKIVDKYLNNKKIKKIIFVENRLMNILINE